MKRKLLSILMMLALSMTMLSACGSEKIGEADDTTDIRISDEGEAGTDSGDASSDEINGDLTFEALSGYCYDFSSGAGAWDTSFEIEKDGYFHGSYYDSDMGDSGDDYPNGTQYICSFTGHFTDLTRIDDLTYEMTLQDLTYANEEIGQEEFSSIDGIRYVSSEAYGIVGTEKFKILLPGTPVADLDEEVYSWIMYSCEDSDTLTSLCLVNEGENEGITSYERPSAAEEAQTLYDNCKSSYDYFEDALENANTTLEMNDACQGAHDATDGCLNALWNLIKYNTDEDTYQQLLTEQRAWLKDRDAQVAAEEEAYAGGSFASVAALSKENELTMERCGRLLEALTE